MLPEVVVVALPLGVVGRDVGRELWCDRGSKGGGAAFAAAAMSISSLKHSQ